MGRWAEARWERGAGEVTPLPALGVGRNIVAARWPGNRLLGLQELGDRACGLGGAFLIRVRLFPPTCSSVLSLKGVSPPLFWKWHLTWSAGRNPSVTAAWEAGPRTCAAVLEKFSLGRIPIGHTVYFLVSIYFHPLACTHFKNLRYKTRRKAVLLRESAVAPKPLNAWVDGGPCDALGAPALMGAVTDLGRTVRKPNINCSSTPRI